jgi:hypothetical protein
MEYLFLFHSKNGYANARLLRLYIHCVFCLFIGPWFVSMHPHLCETSFLWSIDFLNIRTLFTWHLSEVTTHWLASPVKLWHAVNTVFVRCDTCLWTWRPTISSRSFSTDSIDLRYLQYVELKRVDFHWRQTRTLAVAVLPAFSRRGSEEKLRSIHIMRHCTTRHDTTRHDMTKYFLWFWHARIHISRSPTGKNKYRLRLSFELEENIQ